MLRWRMKSPSWLTILPEESLHYFSTSSFLLFSVHGFASLSDQLVKMQRKRLQINKLPCAG